VAFGRALVLWPVRCIRVRLGLPSSERHQRPVATLLSLSGTAEPMTASRGPAVLPEENALAGRDSERHGSRLTMRGMACGRYPILDSEAMSEPRCKKYKLRRISAILASAPVTPRSRQQDLSAEAAIGARQNELRRWRLVKGCVAIVLCGLVVCAGALGYGSERDALSHSRLLGRGINLGNALEAPKEGEWGVTLKPEYFHEIKQAGFNSVRVPIRWSAHAATQSPYTIDASFFDRIDWVVNQALSNDLVIVLDLHHYYQMEKDPDQNVPRLIGLWRQIAEHYRNSSDHVYFELLNEPSGQLSDEKWQTVMSEVLRTIRESNPNRTVIIGPGYWNSLDHLANLILPKEDNNIIVTFHYYIPIQFTFQGSDYHGSDKWKGTTWSDTPQEHSVLEQDFDKAAAWAAQNHRPLYLGEFGSYQVADMQSHQSWTQAVVEAAQKRGFSWSYWEFCSGFGAYDPVARTWRAPLLRALMQGASATQN